MAVISLVRIDSRLIHGQVITKWMKQTEANRIVVIDTPLSKDPFLSKVYTMAAPPGTPVEVLSQEDAIAKWNAGEFGSAKLLILFRDVASARSAFEKGFPIKNLQVGGLGGGPGRKTVYRNITLDEKDVENLSAMQKGGVSITFQTIPEDNPADFDSIKAKLESLKGGQYR